MACSGAVADLLSSAIDQSFFCCSSVSIGMFIGFLFFWEGATSLVQAFREPVPSFSRRKWRQLDKRAWHRHHAHMSHRLPALLVMLPAVWMILTHAIMCQGGGRDTSPFPPVIGFSCRLFTDICHRLTYLDRLMGLDLNVFGQVNNAKATCLFHVITPPDGDSILWQAQPLMIRAKSKYIILLQSMDDCCMSPPTVYTPCVYDPVSSEVAQESRMTLFFSDPHAFMIFNTGPNHRQPIIFNTGASLAIAPDKTDFDGPLTVPKGDLRLGGMANGLKIGMGPVTWTFANDAAGDVVVRGMTYYVPKATARLLSPQQLFDASTGMYGHYEGDHQCFRLHIQGSPTLIVEYDERNSLSIAYAIIGPVPTPISNPQMNLSLLNDSNQNLTGAQKLLLHWHCRFGHLNFPSVQHLFCAVPFLSTKFAAASKCAIAEMRCEICEYAKAHRRPRRHATLTPNDVRDGALKANPLKPGAHVSVDHFKSSLLGRTFDSYGKASSATYKGGCLFVDHCSGYLHVKHQLGFSAIETVRAKQAFEQLAMHHGVVVEVY